MLFHTLKYAFLIGAVLDAMVHSGPKGRIMRKFNSNPLFDGRFDGLGPGKVAQVTNMIKGSDKVRFKGHGHRLCFGTVFAVSHDFTSKGC
jgi:hypothetical protein